MMELVTGILDIIGTWVLAFIAWDPWIAAFTFILFGNYMGRQSADNPEPTSSY